MFYKNFSDLYGNYDSFFIDVYGVLYNGSDFFDGVLDLLEKMKKANKKLIILSNTTLVSDACKMKYREKGLLENIHYDMFISSGEAFKQTLQIHISGAKTYFSAFLRNKAIFDESGLCEVESIEKSDFVYVGALNKNGKPYIADNLETKNGKIIAMEDLTSVDCHEIEGIEEISNLLDICLKENKTLVIANPDIFALENVEINGVFEKRPVLCQGIVGEFYEKFGGKVIYFGKPYSAIYDFAKKFISKSDKTAMIGDTLWTDILGGNIANIETVLTLTGVSGEFFKTMDKNLNIDEKIDELLTKISSKMTHKNMLNHSQIPTHIVESFA